MPYKGSANSSTASSTHNHRAVKAERHKACYMLHATTMSWSHRHSICLLGVQQSPVLSEMMMLYAAATAAASSSTAEVMSLNQCQHG